ncbi:hypothetical protein [Fonticella tunisiensis]|uniref:Uncharacterized protein n=1 Tax=Fonticella tunisiensis TaxID=1096341 RepID=A0A4R7KCY5_9CLOT|nr:hypothetical protein [Fonticella tunisiensis]TDT50556.1 hypothetical protein EDD71_12719 [Fonticella tunisiensis]
MEDLFKQILVKLDSMEKDIKKDIDELKFDVKDIKQKVTATNDQNCKGCIQR